MVGPRFHVSSLVICLTASLAVATPQVALAQQPFPESGMGQVLSEFVLEVPEGGDSLGAVLGTSSVVIDGSSEDGFLPPVLYDADQFTRPTQNFGGGPSTQAFYVLACFDAANSNQPVDVPGRIRMQVLVQDSASGRTRNLIRLSSNADGNVVRDIREVEITKLKKGDTLLFQILNDTVSPLESVICVFRIGIFREFRLTGSAPGVGSASIQN